MDLTSIVDFGLVVLIWMVQLVVYPSFQYYQKEDLFEWHAKYTRNITYIVLPLMTSQLGLHGYNALSKFDVINSISLILVILTWVNTFYYAVPLHKKIMGDIDEKTCSDLVRVNWYRTVLWSLVFALGFFAQ